MQTWRDLARPIIAGILARARAEEWDDKRLRRELRDAYPFGMREYWPYKVWCDEIRLQRGLKRDGRARPRPSLVAAGGEAAAYRAAMEGRA